MVTPPLNITAKTGKVRWVMVIWAFIVAAVSYLDRNNLSIAASAIKAEYGLTTEQLGLVFSAFALGYALMQPIVGRVADKVGPYKVIAWAIVWWGVFTAATPLIPSGVPHSLFLLIIVRALLGVGEAIIFPACNRLVANWIPSRERGLANGLIFAGVGIGGGIAPPLVTYIMITYGWEWAFYASAIIGFIVGGFWLLIVRDRPSEHKGVSEAEVALIRDGMPPQTVDEKVRVRWIDLIFDRQIAVLTLSYFCFGYVAYIFFSWFFTYLSTVRGLNLKTSAIYTMLPFIAMTVFSTFGGYLSDQLAKRYGKRVGRCGVAGFGMVLASVFVALATQVADARLASLILTGGAGALFLAQSAYWALSADIGGRASGSVSGLMNMGAQLGGVVTAYSTALVAERIGWTPSFLVAAAVCLVGGLAWILVDPHHQLRVKPVDETAKS